MTQDQEKARRRGEAFWRRALKAHRHSGLTQAEFCRRNELSLSTFHYWRRRLRETEPELSTEPLEVDEFLEVQIRPPAVAGQSEAPAIGGAFELTFPSGLKLKVPVSVEGRALAEVLWALEATGVC